jgi:hypothetical protein
MRSAVEILRFSGNPTTSDITAAGKSKIDRFEVTGYINLPSTSNSFNSDFGGMVSTKQVF